MWIRLPGGVFTPAVVFDPLTFFGEPALQFTPDDTLFVSFVKRIEGPEAWQHELHRIDVPAGSMELLEATTEFEVVYHAESRSSYWWATTTEGAIDVRHGADRATISIDSEGISLLASSLRLTSSRGRGAAHWSSSDSQGVAWWAPDTSYETAPGVWSALVRSTPDRETERPDDAHPGDSCAIDDHRFYVGHVGGDALDLLGFEHTARGDAVFQCSGPYEPSDQQVCQWHDWSPDVESRSWLVAARGDGSFERLLDVTDYHSVGYSVQRGTDGDLHLLLTTTTLPVEQIEVRYVRVACKGPSL